MIKNTIRDKPLPPGQVEIATFPRFGLSKFSDRFPTETEKIAVDIEVGGEKVVQLSTELRRLEQVQQVSDFHCVTTWTKRNVNWSGYPFREFYEELVIKHIPTNANINFVVFRCQDGYRVGMYLEDLMRSDILLADKMDGQPLSIAHGAPLRLVAPPHYGYKNAKHINKIEFLQNAENYQPAGLKVMDHPRARVELEERGRIFPGWLLRRLYRPLIKSTVAKFNRALVKHESGIR